MEIENPKKYDSSIYKKFVEKNQERIKETVICPICKGRYQYFNKSKHNKTKRHMDFVPSENN